MKLTVTVEVEATWKPAVCDCDEVECDHYQLDLDDGRDVGYLGSIDYDGRTFWWDAYSYEAGKTVAEGGCRTQPEAQASCEQAIRRHLEQSGEPE